LGGLFARNLARIGMFSYLTLAGSPNQLFAQASNQNTDANLRWSLSDLDPTNPNGAVGGAINNVGNVVGDVVSSVTCNNQLNLSTNTNACTGEDRTVSGSGLERYESISWTVNNGSEIVGIAGVNVAALKQELINNGQIIAGQVLAQISVNKDKTINMTFNASASGSGVVKNILITGNSSIEVGKFFTNLLNSLLGSNPAGSITVRMNKPGIVQVSANAGGVGVGGACGSRGKDITINVIGAEFPASTSQSLRTASNLSNILCNETVSLQTDWINNNGGVTYSWTAQPNTVTTTGGNNTYQNFAFSNIGSYNIILNATDACGRTAQYSRQAIVKGTVFPADIVFNSTASADNIPCSQAVNIYTSYANPKGSTGYAWSVTPGTSTTIQNATNSTANFNFVGSGAYNVALRVTDACGLSKLYTKPFVVKPVQANIWAKSNYKTNAITTSYSPSCFEASQGVQLSVEPYLSNNAVYEWILPAGWRFNGSTPYKTEQFSGMNKYYYRGNNLRYTNLVRENVNASPGDISILITNYCGADQYTLTMAITNPGAVSISLPANIISCNASVPVSPIISNATPPYKLNYWSNMNGTFAKGSSFTSTDASNTFVAQRYSNGTLNAFITDSRGCQASTSANISVFGGGDPANSASVSGWLSGHINPQQRATISSNISKDPNANRVYFVRTDVSPAEIYFYEFDNAVGKWMPKATGIKNVSSTLENQVTFVTGGQSGFLFYINNSNRLGVTLINPSTGTAIPNKSYEFTGIEPREVTATHAFTIESITGTIFRVIWKDASGNLYSEGIQYDGSFFLEMTFSKVFLAGLSADFTLTTVRYDIDKVRNRIFYFKSDGGFYTRKLINPIGAEQKLNGVLNGDDVWTVSDIVFDKDNNVYFVANGDVYMCTFDASENYTGIYKIETVDGAIASNLAGAANGQLTLNRTSNVLYYAGYNGNMYQLYRKPDFATSKAFGVAKSTPSGYQDFAASSLLYSAPNVFYRTTDKQVGNLFFMNIPQVATCFPSNMRQEEYSEIGTEIGAAKAVRIEETTTSTQATVYPNPATSEIVVSMPNYRGEGSISLYYADGNKILEQSYIFGSEKLDLSVLPSGLYLLKASTPTGENQVLKVVKK
jgi:hypothetical protein